VDPGIQAALDRDRTIDITTIGRRSGQPRRIEIWSYRVDGRVYLSGSPGRRDWYANLLANPDFTFHLKRSAQADLPARARPVTDPGERRAIVTRILEVLGRAGDVDAWVARSPLVEVEFSRPSNAKSPSTRRPPRT
jgi:deazaflavin-dependent oxidoreductase (nitroreductase family)